MKLITAEILSGFFLAVFATIPASATSYTFTQLPIAVGGLNDLGQIVGLVPTGAFTGPLAVVYNNGTITSLGFQPNSNYSQITPIAINDTGLVVAELTFGHSAEGLTYQIGTGATTNYGLVTFISGVNNKGEVVERNPPLGPSGSISPPNPYPGVFEDVVPTGINDIEQVVGYYTLSASPGSPGVPLDYLDHTQGFLLSAGIYTTFVVPGATATLPVAINNRGEIVGTFTDAAGRHGFEDENGVFSVIVGPDGEDFLPMGLNNLGQIVGATDLPSIYGVSYLATPQTVPEPSTLALLSAGSIGLFGWRLWSGRRRSPVG